MSGDSGQCGAGELVAMGRFESCPPHPGNWNIAVD